MKVFEILLNYFLKTTLTELTVRENLYQHERNIVAFEFLVTSCCSLDSLVVVYEHSKLFTRLLLAEITVLEITDCGQ